MDKYKYLLKNMGLFLVASFIPKAMSFFMVPLYTNCLSTSDYGTADLLTNTVALLMPILTVQVQDAVMKFALENRFTNADVFSVGAKITLFGAGLLVCSVLVISKLELLSLEPIYLIFLCVNYFFGSFSNILSYFCRGIGNIKIITVSSIICSFITISCNLVFLLGFKWGLLGYLTANSLGNIVKVFMIFFSAKIYRYFHIKSDSPEVYGVMIKFSVPMVFSALSWWINNASDKYVLTYFCSLSTVGIFAVASKIPTILSTFGDVVAKSFAISAIKEYDPKDQDGFLGNSYSAISYAMTVMCSIIILLNIPVCKILFAKDFYIAWKFVPPLLMAVLMNQLSLSCENIYLAIGKTSIISTTAMLAAVCNIILNFILIPRFGGYGAALATAFGFFIAWMLRYFTLQKYIKLKHDFKKEVLSYILLSVQIIFAYYGAKFIILQGVIFILLILVHYKILFESFNKIRRKIMK